MGCVSSKRNINNFHSNVYEVINVDEDGNKMSVGHLEVTETDLILHQKHKPPTVWPLKSLRRYGADSELFSFESGRRAPTGEGIFAFRCQKAEQLFNHLQAQITAEDNATQNSVARTPDSLEPSGYLEPTQPRNMVIRQAQWNSSGRMDSINSSGPVSPPPVSPPPGIPPMPCTPATPANAADLSPLGGVPLATEEADDSESTACDDSNNNQHPYINYGIIEEVHLSSSHENETIHSVPAYMNIEVPDCGDNSSVFSGEAFPKSIGSDGVDSNGEVLRDHLYMNVVPGFENTPSIPAEERVPPEGVAIIAKPVSGVTLPFIPKESQSLTSGPLLRGRALAKLVLGQSSVEDSDMHPCYTNLSPSEREGLGFMSSPLQNLATVNYAVLDLNQQPSSPASSITPTTTYPDLPKRSYATIDFNKTEALSHSVNPSLMDMDHEGCRKTRHNSTISDLPTPVD